MPSRNVVTAFVAYRSRILLLKRSRRVGTYPGLWAAVSGYIEPGVEPETQARTEIGEETGIVTAQLVLAGESLTVEDPPVGAWRIHPFLFATAIDRVALQWENDDYRWIEPTRLGEFDTVPGLARVLGAVWQGGLG